MNRIRSLARFPGRFMLVELCRRVSGGVRGFELASHSRCPNSQLVYWLAWWVCMIVPGRWLALPAGYLQRVDHQLGAGVVGDRRPHDPAVGWSRHLENPDRDIFSTRQAIDTAVLASGSSWTHRNPMLGGCSPGRSRPRLVSRSRLPFPVHGSCVAPRSAHDARHWSGFGLAGVYALGHHHLRISVRKNGSGSRTQTQPVRAMPYTPFVSAREAMSTGSLTCARS